MRIFVFLLVAVVLVLPPYLSAADAAKKKGGKRKQGESCLDVGCKRSLTCVKYYGIGGPSVPELSSCEIPCRSDDSSCPAGQSCITIADGPGRVCRPETKGELSPR